MTPETFRAKAHAWFKQGRGVPGHDRLLLVPAEYTLPSGMADVTAHMPGRIVRIGSRSPMHEPPWFAALRNLPVRSFGRTPEEEAEANRRATLRSVLPEGFEIE
jgi:hypothetical protein